MKGWNLRPLLTAKRRRDAVDTVVKSLVAVAKVLMNWKGSMDMPMKSPDKNKPEDIDEELTMK